MKNLINIEDLTEIDVNNIVCDNVNDINFNKIIGLFFEKPSTRTKTSFISSIFQMGGKIIDLKKEDLNLIREESLTDTAKAFNCYLDGLIVRTNDHSKIIKLNDYFDKPLINALSDLSHPCQGLSDLNYLYKIHKNLNFKIVWMGDITNVCRSILDCLKKINTIEILVISTSEIISKFEKNYLDNNNINFTDKINNEYLSKANCIMTDVFISMNDDFSENKIENLMKYQVNEKVFQNTSKDCIFMHCLPAKVNVEVSDVIINSKISHVWQQAKNKMYSQKTILKYINWDD